MLLPQKESSSLDLVDKFNYLTFDFVDEVELLSVFIQR